MISYFDVGTTRLHDVSFTTRSVKEIAGLTGLPTIRGEAPDRPENDGAVEPLDQFLSARVVTITGEVWGSSIAAAWTEWDTVLAALDAARYTATLCKWQTIGSARQVQQTGRTVGEILPVETADEQGPFITYQAQLRFADPTWLDQTLTSQSVGSPTVDGGMPLPVVFPIPFGSGSSGGSMTVTNTGRARAWPQLTITGPITNPVVENTTLGRALYFTGLTLGVGAQLVIETNPATPRSATVAGSSVLGAIDPTVSKWWWLAPGANSVRFYGTGGGYGVGTNFAEQHRNAWLT